MHVATPLLWRSIAPLRRTPGSKSSLCAYLRLRRISASHHMTWGKWQTSLQSQYCILYCMGIWDVLIHQENSFFYKAS